jgi:outer membrane protein insertion porin family/translocation and assembly module TamA
MVAGGGVAADARGQTIREPEITSLEFDGNEAFSDGELRVVLRSQATACKGFLLNPFCWLTDWGFAHRRGYLDSLEVVRDELRIQLFYADRGFFQTQVDGDVARSAEKASVLFTITEGPATIIDSFSVTGVPDVLDSETVTRLIGLDTGDRFDQYSLAIGKDSLLRAMREEGYIRATVLEDLLRRPGGGASVSLLVDPGRRYRVGDLILEGADDIGEDVVRSLVQIGPGDFYRQSLVDDGQRTLFGVEAIRFASIQPEAVDDSIVNLRVTLTPARTRAARGGLGWSTDQCIRAEARLTHRNFFGGAKRLQLTARLDNIFAQQFGGGFPCTDVGQTPDFRTLNFLLRAELTDPVFISGRNTFRASVFGQRETFPDVFIRQEIGAELGINRTLSRAMSATFGYQPSYTGFDEQSADIFFCVSFGFCTPEDIAIVTKARWLSPLILNWAYDRTNQALQPTGGYYLTAAGERAASWTGSEYRYYRLTGQAARFQSIERDLVWATRVRLGFVKATGGPVSVGPEVDQELLHPSKRFFAGGSQSVRGFRQNLLGPRVLVADQLRDCPNEFLTNCVERIARENPRQFDERPSGGNAGFEFSTELRQRLTSSWVLVLFIDAGGIYEDLGKISAPTWTPGAGLRLLTPVGPLRLDIGYNPSGPTPLPVVVSLQNGSLVALPDLVTYDPFTYDNPGFLTQFWRRLQIHISIGEAF